MRLPASASRCPLWPTAHQVEEAGLQRRVIGDMSRCALPEHAQLAQARSHGLAERRTVDECDFQTFELLEIVEKFAVGFEDLPALIQGRDDYRILISTGVVVRAYSVVGQASPDGAIELISLDLDTEVDWS